MIYHIIPSKYMSVYVSDYVRNLEEIRVQAVYPIFLCRWYFGNGVSSQWSHHRSHRYNRGVLLLHNNKVVAIGGIFYRFLGREELQEFPFFFFQRNDGKDPTRNPPCWKHHMPCRRRQYSSGKEDYRTRISLLLRDKGAFCEIIL